MKIELYKVKDIYKKLIKNYTSNKKLDFDKTSFVGRYLFRPTSLAITPLFIALKCSPNTVTFISTIVGLAGATLFSFGSGCFFWAFLLVLLAQLLDYIDGNIARFSNSTNYFGKFIDGLSDSFWYTLTFIGMGIGLYKSELTFDSISFWDKSYFLIAAGFFCFIELFSSFSEVRFIALRNELYLRSQRIFEEKKERYDSGKYFSKLARRYLWAKPDFFYILLFAAVLVNKVHWFFAGMFIYEIGYFVLSSGKVLIKAKKELNHAREF